MASLRLASVHRSVQRSSVSAPERRTAPPRSSNRIDEARACQSLRGDALTPASAAYLSSPRRITAASSGAKQGGSGAASEDQTKACACVRLQPNYKALTCWPVIGSSTVPIIVKQTKRGGELHLLWEEREHLLSAGLQVGNEEHPGNFHPVLPSLSQMILSDI
ncbi:hypothetical protein FQA47_015948 [Oryzias melastigma]|uniref:Uncharacterized protein n=1 Tax=Oryzias melastigma TaxID=30732 RepID=A0A834CAY9_ORYME|nr:hypothetical protein FQA47_015948 [Oryzias melastigma]